MSRYSAFIALETGHYREVENVIEAPDPRAAAQLLIESGSIEFRDDFPIILIVEEHAIALFTHDGLGQAVTPTEGLRRRIADTANAPHLHVVSSDDGPSSS